MTLRKWIGGQSEWSKNEPQPSREVGGKAPGGFALFTGGRVGIYRVMEGIGLSVGLGWEAENMVFSLDISISDRDGTRTDDLHSVVD